MIEYVLPLLIIISGAVLIAIAMSGEDNWASWIVVGICHLGLMVLPLEILSTPTKGMLIINGLDISNFIVLYLNWGFSVLAMWFLGICFAYIYNKKRF